MTFAEKLLHLRKREGYSQEELANILDVSRQAISRWEVGTAVPDSSNLLHISKLFGVSTDFLLNDDYDSDNDLPKVKEQNKILQMNLSKIAIIGQVAALNVAMQPFYEIQSARMSRIEFLLKFVPLLVCTIWMAFNLRYEKDAKQYKKNVKIELVYCMIQAGIFLFGYYSKLYWIGTLLLILIALVYILWVNPRYMNRRMTK